MDEIKIKEILQRYQDGKCSAEEQAWVESWYLSLTDKADDEETVIPGMELAKKRIWTGIRAKRPVNRPKRNLYPWVAAAAVVLFVLSFVPNLYKNAGQPAKEIPAVSQEGIKPGGNHAYLTLADGKKMNLAEIPEGGVLQEAGVTISKKANGELVYEAIGYSPNLNPSLQNTIETPVGGQYQVVLPDGTKVWLNASSSLQYPVCFSSQERRVQLTGEAYFEVMPDKDKPFRVVSAGQTVEVLGTKFNVNSYKDEPFVKTTLLEGSVKVSLADISKIIVPGEQALNTGNAIQVSPADTDQAVAWYKGDFAFDGVELEDIMRQICRWYDVEVVYQGDVGKVKFGGSISRSKDIHEVLNILAMTGGVTFKIEGRRVFVML